MAEKKALEFWENPATARMRFKLRGLTNAVFVGALFAGIAYAAKFTEYSFAIDVIAGVALGYLYFYILGGRPVGMRCNHCRGYISSNTPWVCGFKQCENQNAEEFPFVSHCKTCGAEPKAYQCHHCQQVIFLSADRLSANCAHCLNAAPTGAKAGPETRAQEREQEKVEKQHAYAMAELDEKLKTINERVKGPSVKTPGERMAESFENTYAHSMGPREYARKKRAEVAELYKNDPELLRDANDAIEDALNKLT
jgi:hypothetical protein